MTITIKFSTDNAAFQDGNRDTEIARILDRCARDFYHFGPAPTKLRDSNGNTIGTITVKGR